MGIKNIKKDEEKSTEANTTLKDSKRRSLDYKKRGDSVNSIEDIPERMSRQKEMKSGGRVSLRGGGICKRGMNKKAYGRNS